MTAPNVPVEAARSLIQTYGISDDEIRAALARHDEWREQVGEDPLGDWDAHIATLREGYITSEIVFAILIALDQRRNASKQ